MTDVTLELTNYEAMVLRHVLARYGHLDDRHARTIELIMDKLNETQETT